MSMLHVQVSPKLWVTGHAVTMLINHPKAEHNFSVKTKLFGALVQIKLLVQLENNNSNNKKTHHLIFIEWAGSLQLESGIW